MSVYIVRRVVRSTEMALMTFVIAACSASPTTPQAPVAPATTPPPVATSEDATRSDAATSPPVDVAPLSGKIYYIRPDGGDAAQCTGLADAAYPGSGEAQDCAWDHLFRALPPGGEPRFAGGESLVVASGSYQIGFGAPGSENCEEPGSFDCIMPPIPSGPDPDHPTRLLGAGWDSGCGDPPALWGSGRPWFILNLTDTSNLDLGCFEITDHSSCVEAHSGGLACERDNPPYGDWAPIGIQAEDSANAHLWNLNIHGLANTGIHAGRLKDWTLDNVRIAANGLAGWDGDLWDDLGDSNTGTMTFRHWTVEWNGCGETYPDGEPTGCWAQEAGGYGDGVGTGQTGGDWIIEDSAFLFNTSDGLDLLYHDLGGRVVLTRVRAEGNAGNQVKVTGQASLTDMEIVGNCAFFEGKPFTHLVDQCRANGNSVALFYTGGESIDLDSVNISGQGDGLIMSGVREGSSCTGEEQLIVRDGRFVGGPDYFDPSDITFLFYQEECGELQMDSDFNTMEQVKNVECGAAGRFVLSGPNDTCLETRP